MHTRCSTHTHVTHAHCSSGNEYWMEGAKQRHNILNFNVNISSIVILYFQSDSTTETTKKNLHFYKMFACIHRVWITRVYCRVLVLFHVYAQFISCCLLNGKKCSFFRHTHKQTKRLQSAKERVHHSHCTWLGSNYNNKLSRSNKCVVLNLILKWNTEIAEARVRSRGNYAWSARPTLENRAPNIFSRLCGQVSIAHLRIALAPVSRTKLEFEFVVCGRAVLFAFGDWEPHR